MDDTELMALIDTAVDSDALTQPDGRVLSYSITTSAGADWALLRLAECEAQVEAVKAQADAAVQRVREREVVLVGKAQRGADYFRALLLEYARVNRAAILGHGKRKSRDYMHGRISYRATGGRLVVVDEAALVAWLVEQPDPELVRTKISPNLKAIQELFKATGEVPPGCEYVSEVESITVDATAPEGAITHKE